MENGEQRRNWWLVLSDSDHKRDYDDYDYDDDYDNGGKMMMTKACVLKATCGWL